MENLEEEFWKDVKDYEGIYLASNMGNVKRNNRVIKKQLRNGYHKLTLCDNGSKNQKLVHRIIAETFIPNPGNKSEVNHINGIRTDNRVVNLEWATRKENAQHSYDSSLQISQKGSIHGKSKLTESDVLEIREKSLNGIKLNELSLFYNVAKSTLSQIINNKRWKHI